MIPKIPHIDPGSPGNFFLIAGPCVVEDEATVKATAAALKEITGNLGIPFIFKASYRKANRTRFDSFTGMGSDEALDILRQTREALEVPVLTDIHETTEVEKAARVADVLQIPAFLCRQTDLLLKAASTGKAVNIKKGQFLSGEAMRFAVEKVRQADNDLVMVTERGTTFGYQDLVVDFRNIPVMQQFDVPVILDCTHSLQQPNQQSGVTGGLPAMIEIIARAGIAAGADGLFIETHPEPVKAKSDAANMLPLALLEPLLQKLIPIREAIMQK